MIRDSDYGSLYSSWDGVLCLCQKPKLGPCLDLAWALLGLVEGGDRAAYHDRYAAWVAMLGCIIQPTNHA